MKKSVIAAAIAVVVAGGYAYNVYKSRDMYNQEVVTEMQEVQAQGLATMDRHVDTSTLFSQTETLTVHYKDPELAQMIGPIVLHQRVSFAGIGPSGDWSIDFAKSALGQQLKDGHASGFDNHGDWHYSLFTGKTSGSFQLAESSMTQSAVNIDIKPLTAHFTGKVGVKRCQFTLDWPGMTVKGKDGFVVRLENLTGSGTEDFSSGHKLAPEQHLNIATVAFKNPKDGTDFAFDKVRMDSNMSLKDGFYDMTQHFQADDIVLGEPGAAPKTFNNPQLAYSFKHISAKGLEALSNSKPGTAPDVQMQHMQDALNLIAKSGTSFSLDNLSVSYQGKASTAKGHVDLAPTDVASVGLPALIHALNGQAGVTIAKSLESFAPALHNMVEQLQQQGFATRNADGDAELQVKLNDGQADVNGHVIPLG